MTRLKPWTVTERRQVADCQVFKVFQEVNRSPYDGTEHPFHLLDSSDWVNVVPLTDDRRVVMVRQWRHGSRSFTLEVPGGLVENDADPLVAAKEELVEETGHQAAAWELLGRVNPNPALFPNRLYTFLATGLTRVGDLVVTPTERTEVEMVPLADVPDLVRQGVIDHALVVSAFALLFIEQGLP
jgi:8-oxo-dGTP pyrophosphatase MutT (NUDIX family)